MAQIQFTTYQEDIFSFDLREAMLGVLRGGRYSGYDTLAYEGGEYVLKHTNGVRKLPKSQSVLANPIGVALTTQGTIIHEDQDVNVSVPFGNATDSVFVLVYMQHEYQSGVSGTNPATYGTVVGTEGAGVPTLTQSYRRVIIGTIEVTAGATDLTGLVWSPKPSEDLLGDTQVFKNLFGDDAEFHLTMMGTVPTDGIIGIREYTEENFITNSESLTSSLDKLDIALKPISDNDTDLMNRALDSENWKPLTDIETQNATIEHHGLLPKLPNDADLFLNGIGGWTGFPAALVAENNLSDLTDVAEARSNLGVLTPSEIEDNYFDDTGWLNLEPGASVSTADFRMKIRRRGNVVTMQGYFKFSQIPSGGEPLFKLDTGGNTSLTPSEDIYNQSMVPQQDGSRKLISFYVNSLPPITYSFLVTIKGVLNPTNIIVNGITHINLSYIA